ncbi:MAG: rhodanese-like domain-containing protein [Planctomycetota bacterium]
MSMQVNEKRIQGESTMQEVLEAYPSAQRALMRRYHIGGCSNCGFTPQEKLVDVLKKHNVLNVGEVIEHIEAGHEQEKRIQITARELSGCLNSDRSLKLLDVRMPEEQDIAMISGALPVNQELVQEMMGSWPKDTPLVTYCHHGVRSLEAASYFIGHGFTNVRSLTGGIEAWANEVETTMARY